MKIPLSWLKIYLPTKLTPNQIADSLTLIGLEVEGVEPINLCFEGVVIGKVIEKKSHPNADKLCIALVSDGSTTFQVVCGAPNCREGIKTAFAKVGAKIGQSRIKRTKLRGIESEGMLCSHKELELSSELTDGIMEFDDSFQEGKDLSSIYGDLVFEIALTPNLVHCANIRGVARELAAITGESLAPPPRLAIVEKKAPPIEKTLSISIENTEACPRYACRLITDVHVAPSPLWLKERIEKCGMRSINNIVDITNLVLLEYGHPLHVFDFEKIRGNHLIVRNAAQEETLLTLENKQCTLSSDMLTICDTEGPIAVAGVIGGSNTEVNERTTSVLLEAAYFNPSHIRSASKRLDIHTEASYRFERGVDPNGVLEALERATSWICELANGSAIPGMINIQNQLFTPKKVCARLSRINRVLGTQLTLGEVETLLNRLELQPCTQDPENIQTTIPTYRHDIHSEIDLIEEVARLHGFDRIHTKLSPFYRPGALSHDPRYLFEKEIRHILTGQGLQELLTCDLISPEKAALLDTDQLIPLLNPRSIEQAVLRPSLLPGLLTAVKHNIDRGIHSISGFEIGHLHLKKNKQYDEPSVASIIMSGDQKPFHWENKHNQLDFFDLKGIVENVIIQLNNIPSFTNSHHAYFHPGQQASVIVHDIECGVIGQLHPKILKKLNIHQPVFFAELSLDKLKQTRRQEPNMSQLPQYPSSTRDWTITLDEQTPVAALFEQIEKLPSKLLESVLLLDLYRSEALGSNQKNVTLRFIYRDRNKTLSIEGVEKEHGRVIQKLQEFKE